jgi:hypothetical protein
MKNALHEKKEGKEEKFKHSEPSDKRKRTMLNNLAEKTMFGTKKSK